MWPEGASLRGGVLVCGNFCYGPHKGLRASLEHGGLGVVVAFKSCLLSLSIVGTHVYDTCQEIIKFHPMVIMSKRFKSLWAHCFEIGEKKFVNHSHPI